MARRAHTTELGSIACEDLTELGAGKEGWLVDNPNLLCALDDNSIALANKSLILMLGWSDDSHRNSRLKIVPDLSPIEAEYITAIEWLVFDDIRVLAAGTSSGYLLMFSLDGDLIHKQIVYPGKILKIRVRGLKSDFSHDISSEEVCVVMQGVIGRFDGDDIQNMLQQWFQETQDSMWNQKESEDSFQRLPYQLWNVNKYGVCADAAITGVMPPPLLEFESSQRYFCAVTIGNDAVISAFRLSEDKSRSLVGAIFSRVVPATFSTIASFSKLIWRSNQSPEKKPEPKPQSFARASPLTCLKDPPRKGEKLTLSPSGTLAAITDSLGRILLLDTQALVVVRLWKGYRDARCLFMEMLVNKDSQASTSSTYHEPTRACTSLVRDFYKNLSVISSKNPDQLYSSACQLWWGGRDRFITLDQFTEILKLPTDEEGMQFHSKQNWPKRSTEALKCVFPHMGVDKRAHSTKELPLHLRIVHAFILKNIMPRERDHDKVTMCDTMILYELIEDRLVDTAQIMFFQLQQAIGSTTTGLPFPHLIKPLMSALKLKMDDSLVEDAVFDMHFMPQDIDNLKYHANISYVPHSPPKMLSLPAPSSKKQVKDEPSGSQPHKPLLRSGVDLEILSKLDSLNGTLGKLKDMLQERLTALITCLETSLTAVLKATPPAQDP